MKLSDHIGDQVMILAPNMHASMPQRAKLVAVEETGIWLECPDITNALLKNLNEPSAQRVVVLFFPYSALTYIAVGAPGVSLSEKAFGV